MNDSLKRRPGPKPKIARNVAVWIAHQWHEDVEGCSAGAACDAQANVATMASALKGGASSYDPAGIRQTNEALAIAKEILIKVQASVNQANGENTGKAGTSGKGLLGTTTKTTTAAPAPAPTPAPAPAFTATPSSTSTVAPASASSTTHAVSITINGKSSTVNAATASDAEKVVTMLKTLESAAKSAGY